MKRTTYRFTGIVLALLLLSLTGQSALARSNNNDDEEAFKYFTQGEEYFKKGNYEDALEMFKKAADKRDTDGTINVNDESRIKEERYVPYGRTVKKVVTYETKSMDYYPLRRIDEIRRIQERQYAAPPQAPMPVAAPIAPPLAIGQSDIDWDIPVTHLVNRDAVAVVIGNRDYQNNISSVDYAVNDAATMKKYLINVLGYLEENIIYEENATKSTLEKTFGNKDNYNTSKLYRFLKRGKSDIFIYYSGHGAPDLKSKQGYFVPSDADPEAFTLTGYSQEVMYDNLAKIVKEKATPNVVIVVEACFSGATEKGLLMKNMSPISIEVSRPLIAMQNFVALTSSSGSEVSSWYPEKGHGLFTYMFLSALRDAAVKGKGTVTAGQIFDVVANDDEGLPYIARRKHNREQTPQIQGDAKRPLMRFPQATQ